MAPAQVNQAMVYMCIVRTLTADGCAAHALVRAVRTDFQDTYSAASGGMNDEARARAGDRSAHLPMLTNSRGKMMLELAM